MFIMKGFFKLHRITRRSNALWSSNDALRRTLSWRNYSSAPSGLYDTLPLAGIHVLDMTRVLAGVSSTVIYYFAP